ncbi:MAG TPA: MBL fold metallo-hydrolase [Dehalococcoidales bacterium]
MQQVSEHIFIETKYLGCNVGVVLTEQGPVVIDTPVLPEDTRDLREQIRSLTTKRIAYLIYTHEHFDHVLGGAGLTKKAVAHYKAVSDIEYLRKDLAGEVNHFYPVLYKEYKDIFDNLNIIPPQITFVNEMTLYAGETRLELSWAGGHSPASILIYVPQDRILFCGDNVDVGMPFIAPYSRFGEWIEALKRIEGMEIDRIVPGHDEVCGMKDVRRIRILFETTRDWVQKLIKAGAAKNQVLEKIDLSDVLPVPPSPIVKQQVQTMVGMMWEEMGEE